MTASKKPWHAINTSKVIRIDAESYLVNRRTVEHLVDVLKDNIDSDVYFWISANSDYDPIYIMNSGSVSWDGYLEENGWNYDSSPLFCIRDRLLSIDTKHNPNVFVIKSN